MTKTTTQQLDQTLDAATNLVNASTVLTWVGVVFMVLVIFGVLFGFSKRKQVQNPTKPRPDMKKPTKTEWAIVGIILLVFVAAFVAVFIGASSL